MSIRTVLACNDLKEVNLYRGLISHSDALTHAFLITFFSRSGNNVGQEQWQAIIHALGKCTKLKSISDYEWSAQVLSDDLEVNLSRKGLNDKSAMAVLVGLLQREQAKRITKLDLRSGRNKAEGCGYCWQRLLGLHASRGLGIISQLHINPSIQLDKLSLFCS